MSTITDVTITRTQLRNRQYRYEQDGQIHTGKSNRHYTHASVYRREHVSEWEASVGREVGDIIVFLHSRADLAVKGNADGNWIAKQGAWSRIPGIVEIQEI